MAVPKLYKARKVTQTALRSRPVIRDFLSNIELEAGGPECLLGGRANGLTAFSLGDKILLTSGLNWLLVRRQL